MGTKVFLLEWDHERARDEAELLRAAGYDVAVETENGGRAYRSIRTSLPDAIVIDLRARPAIGREVGRALRDLRATRRTPIVCLEDDEESRERTREAIADVRFATTDALADALAIAIEDALEGGSEPEPPPRSLTRLRDARTSEAPLRARDRIPSTGSLPRR
jgi:DNA-binding NarL/FixJ family response regulator